MLKESQIYIYLHIIVYNHIYICIKNHSSRLRNGGLAQGKIENNLQQIQDLGSSPIIYGDFPGYF